MKELIKFKPYRNLLLKNFFILLGASLLTLISFGLEMVFPVGIGKGVDLLFQKKSFEEFLRTIFIIFIIIFLILIFRIFYNFILIKLRKNIAEKFHLLIFDNFLNSKIEYYESFKSGELARKLSGDVDEFLKIFSSTSFELLGHIFMFIIGLIIIFLYSWIGFIITIILISTIFYLNFLLSKNIREKWRKYFEIFTFKEGIISENILGFFFIKINNLYNFVKEKYSKNIKDWLNKEADVLLNIYFLLSFLLFLSFVSIFLIFGILGTLFHKQNITIGEGITISVIIFIMINTLSRINANYTSLQSSIVAGLKIKEMLESPKEEIKSGVKIDVKKISTIKFENVEFQYPTNKSFLLKVSYQFEFKKVYGIVGRSGSGKSTFIKLLIGFYFPQKGKILIDNIDLREISLLEWRNQIGFLPQDPFIIKGTIEENIKLDKSEVTKDKVIEAIEKVGLKEYIDKLPNGLNTIIGERGITISGGEKQRIALARVFLRNPPIIILDEPTAQLDLITQKLIKNSLFDWKGKKTIFIITHTFSFIDLTDQVILFDNGEIIDVGTHEILVKNNLIYKEMYEFHKGSQDSIIK
ncbi:MAG: ABC transporter ATP-binding protein [Nitrososphaerota archaeon]